ncbi:MAG: hypothetical protein ACYTEQ_21845 [Planctomycetota bacterium]|jgi:hypothetical protein
MTHLSPEEKTHRAKQVVTKLLIEGKTRKQTCKEMGLSRPVITNIVRTDTYNQQAIKALEEHGLTSDALAKKIVDIINDENVDQRTKFAAIKQAILIFGLEAPKEEVHTFKTFTEEALGAALDQSAEHYYLQGNG